MSKNSYKYCHTAHGDILNGQLTVQNPKIFHYKDVKQKKA